MFTNKGGNMTEQVIYFEVLPDCSQGCGAKATVYAGGRGAGDCAGKYCEPCAKALRFDVWDRYAVKPTEEEK